MSNKKRPVLLSGGRVVYMDKENDPYYPRSEDFPQFGCWDDDEDDVE